MKIRASRIVTYKNSVIALLCMIVFVMTAFLYNNRNKLLSTIIPGYTNNPTCQNHRIIASKSTYEIPAASKLHKGILLNVESWGKFSYIGYAISAKSVDDDKCQATVYVEPNNPDSGVIISIGNNLNSGYSPFVTVQMDLYVDVKPEGNDPYDAEHVIQSFADSFELIEQEDKIILRPHEMRAGDDTSYIRGAWVFQKYNGQEYPASNSFKLVSTDNGNTWEFNPITVNY